MIETDKTYTYDELSDEAKETAVSNHRDVELDDFWHEYTIEDAKMIGEMLGIDIDKVYFSGFASQGDGACFVGDYGYKKGALKEVKFHASQDEELHRIARELQDIQRRYFYSISANVKHSGMYCHEMCTDIDVADNRTDGWDEPECADEIRELLRDYMRWIYKQLEKEYNYRRSDEGIIEDIKGLEKTFTEDGEDAE